MEETQNFSTRLFKNKNHNQKNEQTHNRLQDTKKNPTKYDGNIKNAPNRFQTRKTKIPRDKKNPTQEASVITTHIQYSNIRKLLGKRLSTTSMSFPALFKMRPSGVES